MEELNFKKSEEFLQRAAIRGEGERRKAAMVLSSLGKLQQFKNAIESPVGREILTDLAEMMQDRIDRIINHNEENMDVSAFHNDLAEFRAYRRLSSKWLDKLTKYETLLKKVNEYK